MVQEKIIRNTQEQVLQFYRSELYNEWLSLLKYWSQYTVDQQYGGFYGSVNNSNEPKTDAAKGIVLISRILWTFSASSLRLKNKLGLEMADRAFNYIMDHFVDNVYGGVYWSVDNKGDILDGKKQIYGLAFCIYGMSEYYKAAKNQSALDLCKKLYNCIEQHSFDKENEGYFEAFTRDWKVSHDLRLSEKDENEKKTMNTHLHIVEAYTNLYRVWPNAELKQRIAGLLGNFDRYFIDKNNFHLKLFMDEKWVSRSSLISFGHDIEAAWLLLQCAETINSNYYTDIFTKYAVEIGDAATEGLDKDGGLWYEYEPMDELLIKEKHSWPQAEAMIGFFNVYELTGDKKYLHHSLQSWDFIKKHIIDSNKGEWFWGINADNSIMANKDKAGFWKCPYHNTRACMEIIERIDEILNNS